MKNLSLNAKFVFILSMFVFTSVLTSVIGVMKMEALDESLDGIIEVNIPRILATTHLYSSTNEIENQEKVFILEKTEAGMAQTGTVIDGLEKDSRAAIQKVMALNRSEETRRDLDEISKILDTWHNTDMQIRALSLEGKREEAIALARGSSKEDMDKIDKLMDAILGRNMKILDDESKDAKILYTNSRFLIISISVSAILLGLILAFVILRSINSSIDRVINGLNDSSTQVTSAAQQIASSSQELSQGATEQASSLEETSSAVEEMNSMVQKNADSAQESLKTSQTSGESASRGKKVVDEMKRAMTDIDAANVNIMNQTNDSNVRMSEITKVIAEIGNKTKVINDIVFQTKLLSFNASVEAARAGEHGKGFAVVAEEVGNLAQMSGNAAKEISTMLDSSIEKVEAIVRETKSSVETLIAESKAKVEVGSRVAAECGDVLDEIVGKVTLVSQMSHSISTASDEQARGISEITKAVTQLDQMTQQNAAISEEAAAAAEELSSQAESMQAIVQSLIQTIKGGDPSSQHLAHSFAKASRHPSVGVPPQSTNVVLLGNKKTKAPTNAAPAPIRMVSGGDVLPSEDDPRFKDI